MAELADRLRAELGDRYVIERELGRGGMAVVFLARDLRHERPVAIKVLKPEVSALLGPERFLHEIRLTARLNHPHLLPLLDSGQLPGNGAGALLYYVMPFVEGEALRDRLDREGQLPVPEAVRIVSETADALAYLHAHGIVHRDIKPENILLSGGHAVVADLGISRVLDAVPGTRLTETGMVLGTAAYMSPEQATGESRLDGRSDIYAVGCVLYELLAGEPPFHGPTPRAILARQLTEPVPPLAGRREVPPELETVIHRALAKAPADRYANAGELVRALAELPTGLTRVATPLPTPAAPGQRLGRLAWAGVALVALAAVFLLARSRASGPAFAGPPEADAVAVLPFTSPSNDTGLAQLGRELATTMSASLDGVGDLRTLDRLTVLARWAERAAPLSEAEDAARARALGAGAIIEGSLVRTGRLVRIDYAMVSTDSLRPLARGSWVGPADINAMTDSVTRSILRQIWQSGDAPTPSLDAALRTRSVPALRAFLEGERALVADRWEDAVDSYSRALDADSGFYLAASRLLLARYWSLQGEDSTLEAVVRGHLSELPPRESRLIGAYLAHRRSAASAMQAAAELVRRYPDYWLGWLFYADWQFHDGPGLGRPIAEAGASFNRALALNPALLPTWDHLGLLTAREGDRVGLARVLRNLDSLHARAALTADGFGDEVLMLRLAERELAGDSAAVTALVDSAALDYLHRPAPSSFFDPMILRHFATQVRVYRRAALLTAQGRGHRAPAEGMSPWDEISAPDYWLSRAWMGRGAWDSAAAIIGRVGPGAGMVQNRTALLAATIGVVAPAAVTLRPPDPPASDADAAEFAWQSGILACLRGDRPAAQASLERLDRASAPAVELLRRSLRAHLRQAEGDSADAGRQLAALELQLADSGYQDFPYPVLPAVDRLHAVRWLLAAGDTTSAERLLAWGDAAFQLGQATSYLIPLTPLLDFLRGQVAEGQGAPAVARAYYRRFVEEYDAPVPALRPLVAQARAGLDRFAAAHSAGAP